MPPDRNKVNLDLHTKTKYFWTSTQKPSEFRSLHWSQENFDPHYKMKSILMPWHQSQAIFDPHTKTKPISSPALKPSQFRFLHWIKSSSIPHLDSYTEIKSSSIPHINQVNFDPYAKIKSSSIPQNGIKSISTTHTKTKSNSMLTLRPSDFWPAYKNQVNFDHPHKK